MRNRVTARLALGALVALAAACSPPEKAVIDQYFNALRAGDNQTLSSFATVKFDKKVDKWAITGVAAEEKRPAPLADLLQKVKDADKAGAEAKKAAQAFNLDHYNEVDQIKEARKGGKGVPPKIADLAKKWDELTDAYKDSQKALGDAKEAVDKEKAVVRLSVGDLDDIESLTGDVTEKKVELSLNIGGADVPYVMSVRKYDLKREKGPAPLSRWVVTSLQPK